MNKYNKEGYYDPTAYEALTIIEREENIFRPFVYICSPYSGDIEKNTANAKRYSRFAVNSLYIPITPHLFFTQFLNDDIPQERRLGMFFGKVLMDKCQEIWTFGDKISSGMEAEISRAKRKKIKIRYFNEECEEVFNNA